MKAVTAGVVSRSPMISKQADMILDLRGGSFTDRELVKTVSAAVKNSRVSEVDLRDASFSVDGLLGLAGLPNLQRLYVHGAWRGLDIGENERQRLRQAFGGRVSYEPGE